MINGSWAVKFELYLEDRGEVHFDELSEASQEHILNQIKEGFYCGELFEEQGEE